MEHYSLCHPQDQTVQFIPCCPSSFSFVIFLCNLMLCTCVCICVLVHICFVIVIFVVNYFYVVSWLVVCVYLYPSTYVGEHVYRLSFCVTLSFDKIDNNNNNNNSIDNKGCKEAADSSDLRRFSRCIPRLRASCSFSVPTVMLISISYNVRTCKCMCIRFSRYV